MFPGKTTINFLHARYMAGLMNRDLIVPYVRNSRYCGLKEGWIGQKRKKSREFFSMENYFDMSSMEQLSPVSPTARLVGKLFTILQNGVGLKIFCYCVQRSFNLILSLLNTSSDIWRTNVLKISHYAENLSA